MVAVWTLLAVVALSAAAPEPVQGAGSRDVLWEIITSCINPNLPQYCDNCRSPRVETPCAAEKFCRESTDVWAETEAYVALRDRKMCGCPDGFVHGLALPRARVTGVEDPSRPDGIWSFAWATARTKIGDGDDSLALVVNPRWNRSQDHLHVHMLRLEKDARERFRPEWTARVPRLDQVWGAASRLAAGNGVTDYGVLVTGDPGGGFTVLIDRASPEKVYTQEKCR